MSTMTLKEKALAISTTYILLGEDAFTPEAWRTFRYGLPLAIMLAEDDQITVTPGSEAEGFIEDVWTWVEPAWKAIQEESTV